MLLLLLSLLEVVVLDKWDLLEFSWHVPIPLLLLFTVTTAPLGLMATARNKLPRHPLSLHSLSMAPIYGDHQSARTEASTSACIVHRAQLEAGDITVIRHFPLHSKIMRFPLMLPSLWCRQSQPGVNTSTVKAPWLMGQCHASGRLYVCNIKIFVYARIAVEKGNFMYS